MDRFGVTLEQARSIEAVVRLGSYSRASKELKKAHTGIMYSVQTFEQLTGIRVFQRHGYRIQLTNEGQKVWQKCLALLKAESSLNQTISSLKGTRTYDLQVVYDNLIPNQVILEALAKVRRRYSETKITIRTGFLQEVEELFWNQGSQIMISIELKSDERLASAEMPPLLSLLVASKDHDLVFSSNVDAEALESSTFLTVRDSDEALDLATYQVRKGSIVMVSDFFMKKQAIIDGMGYGWLPREFIREELEKGLLKLIPWHGHNSRTFEPTLFYRRDQRLNPAAELFVDLLRQPATP